MTITAFYDRADFFGSFEFVQDTSRRISSDEELKKYLKKCFDSFGKLRNFSFRVDLENSNSDRIVIEQSYIDREADVFTIQCCYSIYSSEKPEKVSRRALTKRIAQWFNDDCPTIEHKIA